MNQPRSSSDQSLRVQNELAQEYLKTRAGVSLKPSTVPQYDGHLTEYTTFLNGDEKSIVTAEFDDILSFVEECVRRGNRESTISGKLSTIAELYRYIWLRTDAKEELNLNPLLFREIDLDKYNIPQNIERESLSKEEIRRLFDAFESNRNQLMAIVGIETGLRNSDIRNLRLQDLKSDQLHVHDPKNSNPYDVPISEQLSFEFDMWLKHQRPGFTTASNSEYVFPSQHGKKLAQNSSLNGVIKDAADRADIQEVIGRSPLTEAEKETLKTDKDYREWKRVTVHTLRHSYISLLEDAGVSLPYRQLMANHADPATTLRYSHGASNVFTEIRDRFDPPR